MNIKTIETESPKNWLGAITDFVQPQIQLIPQEELKPVIDKPDYTPLYIMGIIGILAIALIFAVKRK